ncbi:MAG: DUF1566 domain-containing protein [Nitrospirota bacterium]
MKRSYAITGAYRWKHFFLAFTLIVSVFSIFLHAGEGNAAQTTLIWNPPIANEDGTPLTGLAGYKVYYGTVSRNYTQSIDVGNVTTYTVPNLSDGVTYYFAATAYNTAQKESQYSNEISRAMSPPPLPQYILTVGKGGTGTGTVISAPAGVSCGTDCTEAYTAGTSVTLSASPDGNSLFSGWSGACAGTGACALTMDAAKSVTATFAIKTFTLTATAGAGGSISPSGTVTVNHGASQTYTITPNTGYAIADVKVDGSSKGAVTTYTFTNVTGHHTITASFATVTYPDISVTPSSYSYGNVLVGKDSVFQVFIVTNMGTENLVIGSSVITGSAEFLLLDDNCSGRSVAPGDRCSVSVYFSPATGGIKSAWLVVPSNDPDTPKTVIPLEGSGRLDLTDSVNLPRTGQSVSYFPGDDGSVQAGAVWPEPRIFDNGDGTVTDTLTGLMWLKDGSCLNKKNWNGALNTIADLNANPGKYLCKGYNGNYTDWRMPNVRELDSLVNYGVLNSSSWMNVNGFTNVKGANYWSSTTASGTTQAWLINLYNGMESPGLKSKTNHIMAVRSISQGNRYDVPVTGQTVSYFPGDDGSVQAGAVWPEPRFLDNGGGTVTDTLTGLMWLKDGSCLNRKNWNGALNTIADLNANPGRYPCADYHGNYTDWRMPNVRELDSLINFGVLDSSAWLNASSFRNIKASSYWTSTSALLSNTQGWIVDMKRATTSSTKKSTILYVWPVRSAGTGQTVH